MSFRALREFAQDAIGERDPVAELLVLESASSQTATRVKRHGDVFCATSWPTLFGSRRGVVAQVHAAGDERTRATPAALGSLAFCAPSVAAE